MTGSIGPMRGCEYPNVANVLCDESLRRQHVTHLSSHLAIALNVPRWMVPIERSYPAQFIHLPSLFTDITSIGRIGPCVGFLHVHRVLTYGESLDYSGGVFRAEKYTGANLVEMQNDLPYRPMDIHVVSDQRQKCAYSPCNVSNGGCSHICKTAANNQVECACPNGQQLKLANDRRMCVRKSSDAATLAETNVRVHRSCSIVVCIRQFHLPQWSVS